MSINRVDVISAMLTTMRARQRRTIRTLARIGMDVTRIAAVTGVPAASVARIIGEGT